MIYVENDFYSNFDNFVKANDDVAIQGMLIDEFSTLIAKRRGEMIQLYQKVGIPLSKTPSNEELSTALVNNITANKKFQAGLAYLIAKNNDILAGVEKSSRGKEEDEKKTKEQDEEAYERTSNTLTAITGTISVLADSLKGDRANEFQKELQDKSNTKAPNYSGGEFAKKNNEKPKKKSKTWRWVLGIAVVGGVLYYAYTKGYIGNKKSGAGEALNVQTPPVSNPVQ